MTKKVFIFLLSAAATLFFAASCITTDKTLGTIYIPGAHDIQVLMAEFDIPVQMKMADSLQSAVTSGMTIGSITSDKFGTFTMASATEISPSTDSIVWGEDPVFVDMQLELYVSGKQYLKDDQEFITQNIRAYQLNFELDSTTIYSNSISRDKCKPDCINVGTCVYMGGDTISMHLSREFGEQLFKLDRTTMDSLELFTKKFYGIYLETDPLDEGLTGGRLNEITTTSSNLMLTFNSKTYNGQRRDTTVYFTLGERYCVNSMTSQSGNLAQLGTEQEIYFEGLSGVKPFISAKSLKEMLANWAADNGYDQNDVLVIKAALEFPCEYSGNYMEYEHYPTNLYPCQRKEINYTVQYSPINEAYESNLSQGSFNRSLFQYRPDAPLYFQNLLKKNASDLTSEDDLWIMSTLEYTSSTTSTTYYLTDYNYYSQARLNGTKAERHPKLILTYTILK